MDIAQIQQQVSEAIGGTGTLPPVESWDPKFCGNMNLVIKRSGQWWHEGTPFTRAPLVKLLASILKKEGDNYYLVTPVEKIGIEVEDVPFVIIDSNVTEDGLIVNTQTGDQVLISEKHPIELRKFDNSNVPYCLVRRNLWARIHQNVLYRWVDEAKQIHENQGINLTMKSGNYTFSIGSVDA